MRRTINITLFLIAIIFCPNLSAQNTLSKNGIPINHSINYSKNEIITLWGEPSRYDSNDSEFGKDERYEYNGNLITFGENGLLNGFDVENTDFSVIWGGVSLCVGDDISTLQNIQNATIQNTPDGYFKVWIGDEFIGVSSSGGKITTISFSSFI